MTTWAKIIIGDSRAMPEVADGSVDLVVTSPPYWHIKDYGRPGQIGHGQSLHDYLRDLYRVWGECFRALRPGGRLCVNIGDQFARASVYGRYQIIPLHAEIITQGVQLGFDFLGAIIWQKKTTMETTGGAPIMGSYPFPPNGLVEIDYEFILILKKPGPSKKVSKEIKEASQLSREEWKEYFAGHWRFGGARQAGHEAMFPEELPRRLIRMFSFVGDTVLDPFLGSGTTVKVARELGRNAIGYDVNPDFLGVIFEKLGPAGSPLCSRDGLGVQTRRKNPGLSRIAYTPALPEAQPPDARPAMKVPDLYQVVQVLDHRRLRLEDGRVVELAGVRVEQPEATLDYLRQRILRKKVFLKDIETNGDGMIVKAQVYLKNRISVNRHLLKSGLACAEFDDIASRGRRPSG